VNQDRREARDQMGGSDVHVVTGAFGYTGQHIARRLLEEGRRVRTLTAHPGRPNPFGDRVEAAPFHFDDPAALTEELRGAAVLYNTYWIRFEHGDATFARAIANSETLIRAAVAAGVGRFVHISITNPSEDSPRPYFRGKAIVERRLKESGLSHAILRPTVLFGGEDILINNIAWLLRRLPVFGIFGTGDYRLQPVHVDDVAALAVELGRRNGNVARDAVGPETYTFEALLRLLRGRVRSRCRLVHLPPGLALAAARSLGRVVGDVVITGDEIAGLMANLLVSDDPPTCPTRFSEWLTEHGGELGVRYASELERHYR
jgi:NADH dehydrogenase